MRRTEDELGAAGVEVVVVTFEVGALAKAYVEKTNLRWPLLVDETRSLYRAYEMLGASFWQVWGPRTWVAYAKAMARGAWPKLATDDVSQRGGDVLVDPGGVVRLHHVGAGPADRPAVQTLLAAVAR